VKNFYIIALFFSFFVSLPVFAAYKTVSIDVDPLRKDFVIGPGKQELYLKPGQTATVNVFVSNRMGEERLFNLAVEDFKGTRDLSRSVELLGDQKGPYSLRDFIIIEQDSFVLENGTRATVPVKISIPEGAEPGGFYGSLLISTVKAPDSSRNVTGAAAGVPLNIRQGVLFFVRVEGDVVQGGKAVDFKIANDKKWFGGNEEVNFQIVFDNNGSVHLNPYGVISVSNYLGQEVEKIEVDPWFSLPDSLRLKEEIMNTGSMFGKYKADIHIYRGFGPLDEEASYDDLSLTFWVIQWASMAWYGFIAITLLFIAFWIRKNFEFRRK
jgi:hypothetical protein